MTDTLTIPAPSTVTEREFLASIVENDAPLALVNGKDGAPARGRFSKRATEVLDAAKAQGFVPKAAKPAAKPRKAKPAVEPVAETVAETATESVEVAATRVTPLDVAKPLVVQPEPVRAESRAWGFTGLRKMGLGR